MPPLHFERCEEHVLQRRNPVFQGDLCLVLGPERPPLVEVRLDAIPALSLAIFRKVKDDLIETVDRLRDLVLSLVSGHIVGKSDDFLFRKILEDYLCGSTSRLCV